MTSFICLTTFFHALVSNRATFFERGTYGPQSGLERTGGRRLGNIGLLGNVFDEF